MRAVDEINAMEMYDVEIFDEHAGVRTKTISGSYLKKLDLFLFHEKFKGKHCWIIASWSPLFLRDPDLKHQISTSELRKDYIDYHLQMSTVMYVQVSGNLSNACSLAVTH